MRIIYGFIVICLLAAIAICAYRAFRSEGKMARIVFIYELVTLFCGSSFLIYTFVQDTDVMHLCKSLTMASFVWALFVLMYYTGVFSEVRVVKKLMVLYSVFDTVMLILNTWTHDIFTLERVKTDVIRCYYNYDSWLYKGHFMYMYLVMIMLLLAFFCEVIKASKFYRFRYAIILMSILTAFLFDIFTIGSETIYDLSMLVFAVMSLLIYYFTMMYIPNELIENTLSMVVKDMNSGIACFDNKGTCVYYNEVILKFEKDKGNINKILEKSIVNGYLKKVYTDVTL